MKMASQKLKIVQNIMICKNYLERRMNIDLIKNPSKFS